MQGLLLSVLDDWSAELGVGVALIVALLIVTVALGAALIVLAVLRLIIFWNYWIARRPATSGITGGHAAEDMLLRLGIGDVKVEKEGFFRALFYNNHYNPSKKTIYLRRTTFFGTNVTSIAIAAQEVSLVLQDRENSAKFRGRWRLQQLAVFGPAVFLPILLIGLILDFAVGFTGIPMLIASVIAFAFFLCSMVLAGLTVSVEKRAAKTAVELLAQAPYLTPEEQLKAQKVLRAYILAYITDFVVAILKLIQLILKIAIQIFAAFESSKNK